MKDKSEHSSHAWNRHEACSVQRQLSIIRPIKKEKKKRDYIAGSKRTGIAIVIMDVFVNFPGMEGWTRADARIKEHSESPTEMLLRVLTKDSAPHLVVGLVQSRCWRCCFAAADWQAFGGAEDLEVRMVQGS